jgi:hypothetical protein
MRPKLSQLVVIVRYPGSTASLLYIVGVFFLSVNLTYE